MNLGGDHSGDHSGEPWVGAFYRQYLIGKLAVEFYRMFHVKHS